MGYQTHHGITRPIFLAKLREEAIATKDKELIAWLLQFDSPNHIVRTGKIKPGRRIPLPHSAGRKITELEKLAQLQEKRAAGEADKPGPVTGSKMPRKRISPQDVVVEADNSLSIDASSLQ